jgi:hypothetical protein
MFELAGGGASSKWFQVKAAAGDGNQDDCHLVDVTDLQNSDEHGCFPADCHQCGVQGLKPNARYGFIIDAHNEKGWSEQSALVMADTLKSLADESTTDHSLRKKLEESGSMRYVGQVAVSGCHRGAHMKRSKFRTLLGDLGDDVTQGVSAISKLISLETLTSAGMKAVRGSLLVSDELHHEQDVKASMWKLTNTKFSKQAAIVMAPLEQADFPFAWDRAIIYAGLSAHELKGSVKTAGKMAAGLAAGVAVVATGGAAAMGAASFGLAAM